MHTQKKPSGYTYHASKRQTAIQKNKNRRLLRLCAKCALCTSVFTVTLLAGPEWAALKHPSETARTMAQLADSRTSANYLRKKAEKTTLSDAGDNPASPDSDDSHTLPENATDGYSLPKDSDGRQNGHTLPEDSDGRQNGHALPEDSDGRQTFPDGHTDSSPSASSGEDASAYPSASFGDNNANDTDSGSAQSPDADTGQLVPGKGLLPDDGRQSPVTNTDEQTFYSVDGATGSEVYPDTDNQVQFSASADGLIQSVPEYLPDRLLVDTTTDDDDTSHVTQVSSDWNLILANPWNKLPEDYAQDLSLTPLPNGHSIDSRCYPFLTEMMNDCRSAGLRPLICSSYRSHQKQKALFQERIDELRAQGYSKKDARTKAATSVARPGTSEHQLGLAVDIVDQSHQILDTAQESTPVQQWLMENSWKYGFILRYPADKSRLTGIIYEPWHYRYVGREAAREIHERGICLEEYLEELS